MANPIVPNPVLPNINAYPVALWEPLNPQYMGNDFRPFAGVALGGPFKITQDMRDATGRIYLMRTPSTIQSISVWVCQPTRDTPDQARYYCQGIGFGTYDPKTKAGYTVLSGYVHLILQDPMLAQRVVPEDMSSIVATNPAVANLTLAQVFPKPSVTEVDAPKQYADGWNIKPGHVVAFWGQDPQGELRCVHSCVIKQPKIKARKIGPNNDQLQWYLSKSTIVDSKNGLEPLKKDTTLGGVMNTYRAHRTIGIYFLIPRPPPMPTVADLAATQRRNRDREAGIMALVADEPPVEAGSPICIIS